MDLFKLQFDRIQKQLGALTASQKMLTAALVAIMVMTLVWWGRYAGDPEMEPLLPQAIGQDELPRVLTELDQKGIKHVMSGEQVMVPSDRRVEAVSSLLYSHALPRNAKNGFDEVIKNINPFWSEKQSEEMWNRGKEMTAAQLISDFPNVADCHVMIDPKQERHVDGNVEPHAIITIQMQPGFKAPQNLVDAAADVVEGAQATIQRGKIRVVVDGQPRPVKLTDNAGGGMQANEQLEAILNAELTYENHIKSYLPISGLMVAVTVKVNVTASERNEKTYDKKGVVQTENETETRTEEGTSASAGGGDTGVGPNTGMSITQQPAASAAPSNTREENKSKFTIKIPEVNTHSVTPAGEPIPVGAGVRVPLDYLTAMYRSKNPDVKNPSDAQMKPMIDAELAQIKKDVLICTNLSDPSRVTVSTYFDPTPASVGPQTVTAGLSVTSLMNSGHVKEVVLGALALVSLFMVSSMVKKGAPAPILASSPAPAIAPGTPILDVGAHLAGQAAETGSMLDGMELDEESVRTQQMLEQVSSLVKESPDSAASLIKRWMNK